MSDQQINTNTNENRWTRTQWDAASNTARANFAANGGQVYDEPKPETDTVRSDTGKEIFRSEWDAMDGTRRTAFLRS